MKKRRLDDSPIVYYIHREKEHAEWVCFLHAAFVDHRMFDKQFGPLSTKVNLLAIDTLGHGESTEAQKGDSIVHMSKWIQSILVTEGIDQVHLIGVSLGAILAQDYANQYPDSIRSLACFGGYNINQFDPEMQRQNGLAQMLMMLKALISIRWFAAANKKVSAYTTEAQEAFYMLNLQFQKKSFQYLARLNEMVNRHQMGIRSYPLLIGCGEYDLPMELKAIELWREQEPTAQVKIFENAGHCVNMDVPEEFNSLLLKFWKI